MSPSSRNPLLHPKPRPVDLTTTETRQLFNPSRWNPTALPDPEERPVGDTETPGTTPITEASPEPWPGRRRDDTETEVVRSRRSGIPFRKEDIREFIKAAAVVGALIVALIVYAAIRPGSAW